MKIFRLLRAGTLVAGTAVLFPMGGSAQVGANVGQLLDPNRATAAELAALPGLNAEIADAIVNGRPWLVMTRLDAMLGQRGLTEAQRETLYGRLWDPLNLNATTEAEILLIPQAGERVAHEFEEYAPYANLAVFTREMSKYWDATEVARLQQYVFVPINLNTATAADILTIPGSGQRVVREFMEYRPYTSMEQFRREMLKYWDEAEVARLEQFVTLGN
jgi:radical SAM superfamily enzyme with C-terminal helix-hairpin-helix motif